MFKIAGLEMSLESVFDLHVQSILRRMQSDKWQPVLLLLVCCCCREQLASIIQLNCYILQVSRCDELPTAMSTQHAPRRWYLSRPTSHAPKTMFGRLGAEPPIYGL